MASLTLKALLSPKTGALSAASAVAAALGATLTTHAEPAPGAHPITVDGEVLGYASGPPALAQLLSHLAAKESERRALAAEVLHLYREIHLIDQLSEQLAALLDFSSIGQTALDQAGRLIARSHAAVLLLDQPGAPLRPIAAPGDPLPALAPSAAFPNAILDRGVAEIVNDGNDNFSLLAAPLRAKQRTVGVIALANSANTPYSAADLKLLNTIALQTATAVENSLLCADMLAAVRDREKLAALERELDTARNIQLSLLPSAFPPFPGRTDFDIHAQMNAAKAVGGDFFDYFLLDETRLGVVIGDVSGKGIPAALFMAVAKTQIKPTALRGALAEDCLAEVNRGLVREKRSSMYATCFYGILDTRTGDFQYCNAGHNPPYVLRASGEVEPLPMTGGLPIGLFDKLPYTGGQATVGAGDTLFFYTDGVPEAVNTAEDEFSEERLVKLLAGGASRSCRDLIDHITDHHSVFTAGAPQFDDITMVALRRN